MIVGGKYAFKIPRMWSWKTFLTGLLANMQEVEFYLTKWIELCPVAFNLPLGFLVVMVKTNPISDKEWEIIKETSGTFPPGKDYIILVERKRNSFGKLNGKIVAIDYGT